jgi:outer membrane protein OmpA-like peptidoglycan-associated protein
MKIKMTVLFLSLALLAAALSGCGTSKAQRGAIIGGVAGAAAGAAVSEDDTQGAIIGGAAGAVIGGLIGDYLDKQAEELEQIEGATVTREGDQLMVTFDSAILFDVDSSALRPASADIVESIAGVLTSYPETDILVMGHTDSTGPAEYNQGLSERRADAVGEALVSHGVASARITSRGYGENSPVADNDTAAGRQENRRVEVDIRVNEEFRARAAAQEG